MTRQTVAFDQPVPEPLADELAQRIYYVSDVITGFTLVWSQAGVTGVELELSADDADLARKLRYVVAQDVLPQKITEPAELWRSPAPATLHDGLFDRLVESGAALEAAEGQVTLGGPLPALMDVLDSRIRRIAVSDLGAVEYRYPTLIPVSVLARFGYLGSFPQQLMFVTRLHADLDTYTAFLEDVGRTGDVPEILSYCRGTDYCLPPTMCFHTFHQMRDAALTREAMVVTSRGKSFRFESRYRHTLERLWDFTIREVVFLGERNFVLDCRQRFLDAAIDLATELCLTGRCEVANDPFFLNRSAELAYSQRLLQLKYELRLSIGADRTIAAASFNFHERFFSDAFAITPAADGRVHTACVGFGLERFTYAFLCHHGPDPADWPQAVAAEVRARMA